MNWRSHPTIAYARKGDTPTHAVGSCTRRTLKTMKTKAKTKPCEDEAVDWSSRACIAGLVKEASVPWTRVAEPIARGGEGGTCAVD